MRLPWKSQILRSPAAEATMEGGAVDLLDDPSVLDPIPGAGFTAVRQRNGRYTILDVPVMMTLAPGERGNKEEIGKKWMLEAVARSKARALKDKYLGPAHIDHHGFLNSESRGAGRLRLKRVVEMEYEGKLTHAVIADIVNLRADAYQACKDMDLPYRSVEVFDWEVPEIASVALMDHHVPHFRMAMMSIAREVEESTTMATLSEDQLAAYTSTVMADARRGFISLSALGKPNGARFLQKLAGFGKTKGEKDEKGEGKEKKNPPETESSDPDDTEPSVGPDTEKDEDAGQLGADEKLDTILECVERIEGYMTGALTPEESKKPVEQPRKEDDSETEGDGGYKENSKMSAELKAQLDAMQKQQIESNKVIAQLAAAQKKSELRLEMERSLRGVPGEAKLRAKCETYLAGADIAQAELQVKAICDAVKLDATEEPAKKDDTLPGGDPEELPEPTFEGMSAGDPKKQKNLPPEVLAYQAKGPKVFDKVVDIWASWRRGRQMGHVESSLKDFIAVNLEGGLGRAMDAAGKKKKPAPVDLPDAEPEESEE